MFVTGLDLNTESQTGIAHEITMVGVGRPSGVLGIVTLSRPFLLTIKKLNKKNRVTIQHFVL